MADTQKIFKEFDFAGYIALRENDLFIMGMVGYYDE